MTTAVQRLPIIAFWDLETRPTRVKAELAPSAIGRGEMIVVIFQNPFTNPDGSPNPLSCLIGDGTNQIYMMIPGQESIPFYAEDEKDIYVRTLNPINGGAVLSANHQAVGQDYTVGDVLTLTGGDGNAKVTLTAVSLLLVLAKVAGGAGYTVGNVLTLTGGNGNANVVVDTVDGGGAILTFHVTANGTGYVINSVSGVAGGTGAGATFRIVSPAGQVANFNITTPGTGYSVGQVSPVTGGTGTGATIIVLSITNTTLLLNAFIYRRRKGGKQ